VNLFNGWTTRKKIQGIGQFNAVRNVLISVGLFILPGTFLFAQNKSDSVRALQNVTVTG